MLSLSDAIRTRQFLPKTFLCWTSFKRIPWRTVFFWLIGWIQPAVSFLKITGHWCRRIIGHCISARGDELRRHCPTRQKLATLGNHRRYSRRQQKQFPLPLKTIPLCFVPADYKLWKPDLAGLWNAKGENNNNNLKIGSQSERSRSTPAAKEGLGGSLLFLFQKNKKIKKCRRRRREKESPTPPSPIARAVHLSSSPPPYRHRPVKGRVRRLTAMHRASLQLPAPRSVCRRLKPAFFDCSLSSIQVPGFGKVSGKGKQRPLFFAGAAFPIMRRSCGGSLLPFRRSNSLPSNQIQVGLSLTSTAGFPHPDHIAKIRKLHGFLGRLSFNQFKHKEIYCIAIF